MHMHVCVAVWHVSAAASAAPRQLPLHGITFVHVLHFIQLFYGLACCAAKQAAVVNV
jgi:hypothetical protein